jgi:eukaryotic-like serine/threonine-protein kinase
VTSIIGAAIGNYRIIAPLGEGGMGAVYLAEHPLIGKRVAIKVLHPELAGDPELVARFFQEARAVNEIGHPNIVDIIDFGTTTNGIVYLMMEYLEGRSLAQWIREEGPLHPADAVWVAEQVAEALATSHARGIVHRDLKPDNVFLLAGPRPRVKVLDFGIAKLNGPGQASARTRMGVVLGTPAYMAPEQCEGRPDIDGRVDVYALGVMLHEMLTGETPFQADGFGAMLVMHLTAEPSPPSLRRPELPSSLDAIVLRALEKDPARRFGSMSELCGALGDPAGFEAGLVPIYSPPPEPVPMLVLPEPTPSTRPTTLSAAVGVVTAPAPAAKRRRLGWSAALLAAALVVFTGVMAGEGRVSLPMPRAAVVPAPVPEPEVPPVVPPVVPPPPVASSSVTVRIVTDVPGAVVFFDGERRGPAGEGIALPPSDRPITVTVKAPGHRTFTRVITPRGDIEIDAKLVPRTKRPPAPACDDCLLAPE